MNMSSPQKKLLLIRHAQSGYNAAVSEAEKIKETINFEERVKDINFSLDLIDCAITDEGKMQTKKAAEKVRDRNITLVFTSPLRRALQTTYEIFKNHKNKPRVIAVPSLREQLGGTCDIADDLDKIQKEFPDFDFSLCSTFSPSKLWHLHVIKNQELKETLLREISSKCSHQEDLLKVASDMVITRMKEVFPLTLERGVHVYNRVIEAKNWICQQTNKVSETEEVAVVAHSVTLQSFTAMDIDHNGNLIGEKYLENCEVYEYEI